MSPLPFSRWAPAKIRLPERVAAVWDDDGDARPDVVALDERRMPDADAGDVGDRVQRAWLEIADGDAEVCEAARGNAKAARRLAVA